MFRRWLTRKERKTLTFPEKSALRKERRAKWRADNPRPKWLQEAPAKLGALTLDGLELLGGLAADAVQDAAMSALSGGRAKHDFAVKRLFDRAGHEGVAVDLAEDVAGELIWRAYQDFAKEG